MAYIPSECSLEEYEKVIYSGDAKNRLYVKHGDTIIGTNGDNNASPFASKLTVKRRILKNGSKTITLNNFISQEIDLVLHDYKIEDLSEEIEIKIGTFIDSVNDYVYVPLGKFLIQDNPTTDKDKTTYKLRDFSIKFDFYYNGKPLIDANGGSATKMQILQDICKQAGVVCKINYFAGCNEKIGIYDNSVTARTYIAYLAEQAGKMASINRYGELIFVDITSDDKIATGEKSIIINDALEKRINNFIIEGKSEQKVTTQKAGDNIFDFKVWHNKISSGDMTISYGKNGGFILNENGFSTRNVPTGTDSWISINAKVDGELVGWSYTSTGISDAKKQVAKQFTLPAKASTEYTLSCDVSFDTTLTGTAIKTELYAFLYDENFDYLGLRNLQIKNEFEANVPQRLSSTFSTNATTKYIFWRVDNESFSTTPANITVSNISIKEGTDTTYTEYVPNSPSPDYPSEIKTVKGVENVFDGLVELGGFDDSTGVPNASETRLRNANDIKVKPNTNYIFSINEVAITQSARYFFYDENKNFLSTTLNSTGKIQTPDNCCYINFYSTALNTAYGLELPKPMMTKENELYTYIPYGKHLITRILGKNLYNYIDNFISETYGLTNTLDEDGSITVSGIPTQGYVAITKNIYITDLLEDGEEYTISQTTANSLVWLEIRARDINDNSIKKYYGTQRGSVTFVADKKLYKYDARIISGKVENWGENSRTITNSYQIEKSDKYTGFEKYKKPQFIIYDLKKENLCNITSVKGYKYSNKLPSTETDVITIEKLNNGFSYVIKDDYYNIGLTNNIILKPNTTYILSLFRTDNNVSSARNFIYNVGEDGSYTLNKEYNETGKIKITFTTDSLGVIALGLGAGSSSNGGSGLIENIKIHEGTGTDDYYELASIGDVKDELDEVSGVLTKRIGKIVLDGTQNITTLSNGNNGEKRFRVEDPTIKNIPNNVLGCICDKYKGVTYNDTRAVLNSISVWSEQNIFCITTDSKTKTLAEFKEDLANNPVTVYYELVKPQIIQLEPTEISTFEGTNNIILIDNIDTNINVNYEGQKHIHNISPDIVESFTVGDTYKVSKVLFEAGVNKFEDGTDDNDTLYLNSDNPYINQQTQINNIYPNVKGFEINSFKTGKILGNPTVDPADLIKIEYNDIIYKTLAQYTLNFGGTMTSTYETTVEHEAKQSNVNNNGTAQLKKFVKAELDNIDAKFSVEVGEVNSSLSDLETNINNTADRVSNTESKISETNANLAEVIGRTTKLEQDSQGWNFEFTTLQNSLDSLDDKVNATDAVTKEIKDYIKFENGNIILKGSDSKCSVVISKEKISFYTNGNESAFISNNELYINDNTVLNKQTIGKWELKPDSEGNLNTRWIG